MPSSNFVYLAADIGGTNSRFALFSHYGSIVGTQEYSNDAIGSFDAALADFLRTFPTPIQGATVGIAAPITGRRVSLTNRNWTVDADRISDVLRAPCTFANDLEVLAAGVIAPAPFVGTAPVALRDGKPSGDRAVVVAAGTGLGAAFLRTGADFVLFPSEAGHTLAPPFDAQAASFHRFLKDRLHVRSITIEHVTRGQALSDAYAFFAKREISAGAGNDPNRAVVRAALEEGDEAALAAVLLYVDTLAVALRELALIGVARAGVFLGGSVAESLAPLLEAVIETRFDEPHSMSGLMEAVPVYLITDRLAALRGAAWLAARAHASRQLS